MRFFAAVNQVFGGSSQLPTTAEHCFVVWTVLNDFITAPSAVVGSWEEPPNIWLTVAKNAFVSWTLNFRVRMLLKGAVSKLYRLSAWYRTLDCSKVYFWYWPLGTADASHIQTVSITRCYSFPRVWARYEWYKWVDGAMFDNSNPQCVFNFFNQLERSSVKCLKIISFALLRFHAPRLG